MKFKEIIPGIGTKHALCRIAGAYLIDISRQSVEDIKKAMLKEPSQYFNKDNVNRKLKEMLLHEDRKHRILTKLILKKILLNKDGFFCSQKELEDDVIAYEQAIINKANENLLTKNSQRNASMTFFEDVLTAAWQDNSISSDEKRLLERIGKKLKITDIEYSVMEAKLKKYPKIGNELHTRDGKRHS